MFAFLQLCLQKVCIFFKFFVPAFRQLHFEKICVVDCMLVFFMSNAQYTSVLITLKLFQVFSELISNIYLNQLTYFDYLIFCDGLFILIIHVYVNLNNNFKNHITIHNLKTVLVLGTKLIDRIIYHSARQFVKWKRLVVRVAYVYTICIQKNIKTVLLVFTIVSCI